MRKCSLGLIGILGGVAIAGCSATDNPSGASLGTPPRHYVADFSSNGAPVDMSSAEWKNFSFCESELQGEPVKLLDVEITAKPDENEANRIVASTLNQLPGENGERPPFDLIGQEFYNEVNHTLYLTVLAQDNSREFVSGRAWDAALIGWADNGRKPHASRNIRVVYSDCNGQGNSNENINQNSNSSPNVNDNVLDNSNFNVNYNDNNGQGNDNYPDNSNDNFVDNANDNQGGPITCVSDSDCGVEHDGLSCNADGNAVVQIDYLRTCENPGTEDSVCVTSNTTLENVVANCGISGFKNQRACNTTTGNIDDVYVTNGCNGGACFTSEELRTVQSCTYGCKSDATCKTLEELQRDVTVQITDTNWTPVDNITIRPGNINSYAFLTTVTERFKNLFGPPSETITLYSPNECVNLGPIAPGHTEIVNDDGTITFERQFGLFYPPECYSPFVENGKIDAISTFSGGFYKVDWVGVNVENNFSATSNGVPISTNGSAD